METDRLLRRPELLAWIGIGRSTLYQWISDSSFPRPVRIGKRAVGWRMSTIHGWLALREAQSSIGTVCQ